MEESRWSKFQILNGNALKLIAIITMLIDHVGAFIIEPGILKLWYLDDWDVIFDSAYLTRWWDIDLTLRMIGRLAFPIFCFLLVEGFLHTKDVKKYLLRLLAFAFISEIPFDLANARTWFDPKYQNVYFTLFIGLLALIGLSRCSASKWKQAAVLIVCCVAARLLHTDYDAFGVFFIALLYLLRDKRILQTIFGCVSLSWEITAPLAFIPIRLYNGERGKWKSKYVFYAFYPVHILALWAIRVVFVA